MLGTANGRDIPRGPAVVTSSPAPLQTGVWPRSEPRPPSLLCEGHQYRWCVSAVVCHDRWDLRRGITRRAWERDPLWILALHSLLDPLVVEVDQAAQHLQRVLRIGEQRDTPGLRHRRGGVAHIHRRLVQEGADEGILRGMVQGLVGVGSPKVPRRVACVTVQPRGCSINLTRYVSRTGRGLL
jgi:hypothetical protein